MNNQEQLPTWKLSDLYSGPEDHKIREDLDSASQKATEFASKYSGKLEELFDETFNDNNSTKTANGVVRAIDELEVICDLLGKVGTYTYLYYTEDTNDPERGRFFGDNSVAIADIERKIIFFTLEINKIDEDNINKLLLDESLNRYTSWFNAILIAKPHQLSEDLEQLMHDKSITGNDAWIRLFDELISGLKFDVNGTETSLEPTLSALSSPDCETRKNAAEALSATFASNVAKFATIFNVLMYDKSIDDRWRSYETPASSRHMDNRVEAEVVDAMADTVREAYPQLSHRYYALKAKWMGVESLNYWDRNAPLPSSDNRKYSFDEAKEIVLNAYRDFSPAMSEIGERFFAEGWIDAPTRPGKSTGAFAHPCVPSAHPYIMLNYQGRTRDVMTLAHELGHGIHQVLAAKQGPILSQTPLTLAETASVFGEMLTFQSLLENADNDDVKRSLLISKVEDMLNTVTRQIAFYTYEQRLHEERKNGEISAQRFGEIWLEVQKESLGSGIKLNEGYENFWCYVSHFVHAPFYVYAYAFGDCLVNTLYAKYASGMPNFEAKYMDLLSAGGTKLYNEALAEFDLNPKEPAFWKDGISTISGFIDQLEEI